MGKFEDLTGQKFGRLTVVRRGENTKNNRAQWWCQCDCGNPNLVLVNAGNLKNGRTKSCGCLARELTSERFKKYNDYNLEGEYGVGYTSNFDQYGRNEFYFDLENYDLIKDYCWCFDDKDYLKTTIYISNGSSASLLLHQLICPTENGYMPDHIRGKETRNDNRCSNLRIVTKSQNAMNQNVRSDNTSGVKGVYLNKKTGKWAADIQKDGKRHYLGLFANFEDAVRARKDAEKKYFGEYAYDVSQAI